MSCANSPQAVLTMMSPTIYEAPLRYCDEEYGPVVAGEFLVQLKVGHSLNDHSLAVGTYLETHIRHIYGAIWPDSITYSGFGVDDNLLARIRADPGVEMVDCNIANVVTLEPNVDLD
ncbi:uncharacterized protein K460DRAFT_363271 [Cucurbitaria berberidis CBS 394.84]|uniref:Uncharacterized protein n=1 Tax=Cucurbitaria berberidis CBS 394.84 TaxID=1168544 RepID=A0A9P4GLA3_9PLEO|nr:uncharacterized protein K460DRAFT_363271 [Cucurbitaria berberidis CBS 394.84]KAF1847166.1 hypothetical protein K460DRAFT_363271 [Cucurbitaria berberidis CBS 394.84]